MIRNHGGGGINFNHSDIVVASSNVCAFNAALNPDQHSGISSFQPIVRTEEKPLYGVVFKDNFSYFNRNRVPNSNGDITDGNGIIVDDHRYTQPNELIADVLSGSASPQDSSGDPQIDVDAMGNLLPYERPTLVEDNLCVVNGGRGIHVFLSDNVDVVENIASFNLESPELTQTLPRDEFGNAFFVFGEISVIDSSNISVSFNRAFARSIEGNDSVAAAELFFEFNGQPTSNRWFANALRNFQDPSTLISVNGGNESDLLDFSGQ